MKKHAYIITAYNNFQTLQCLLDQIDDERNDIYIHFDLKTKVDFSIFHVSKSILTFTERVKVYWGDYGYIKSYFILYNAVVNSGVDYSYIHLLSGQDLCIKSQDEIHNFFNDNNDMLYFHINVGTYNHIQNRCKYYYPFISNKFFRNSRFLKVLSIVLGRMQALVGINRLRNSPLYPIYNGWDWLSITLDFAKYVVTQESLCEKTFKKTLSNDETWIQTLAMHSKFRDKVYGYNGKDDAMDASKRLQDWKRGKPYTFTLEDYNMIVSSPCFFARKFSDNDIELVKRIVMFTKTNLVK